MAATLVVGDEAPGVLRQPAHSVKDATMDVIYIYINDVILRHFYYSIVHLRVQGVKVTGVAVYPEMLALLPMNRAVLIYPLALQGPLMLKIFLTCVYHDSRMQDSIHPSTSW